VIDALCFVPCAPALVPEVGRGLDEQLAGARAAIASVLGAVAATGRQLVLVGPGPADAAYPPEAPAGFAGFGLAEPAGQLPPALAIGRYFAGAAPAFVVGPRGNPPPLPGGPIGLVVLGDGSARRTEKAPGYLDERAAGYDEAVRAALASGDPAQLAALDLGLGAELLAAGAPVWHAIAPLLTRPYRAQVRYEGDPFGVDYVVALWE
jgi:hypothetical protein